MEAILHTDSSYVVVPKRYFSRYVLTYEVLPLSLCYCVDNLQVLDASLVRELLSSDLLDKQVIILEFVAQGRDAVGYISLADLVKVWFLSEETMEQVIERSYKNYDVARLDVGVLPFVSKGSGKLGALKLALPAAVNKQQVSGFMTYVDGVMALLH